MDTPTDELTQDHHALKQHLTEPSGHSSGQNSAHTGGCPTTVEKERENRKLLLEKKLHSCACPARSQYHLASVDNEKPKSRAPFCQAPAVTTADTSLK